DRLFTGAKQRPRRRECVQGRRMFRKLALAIVVFLALCAGIFWILTIPKSLSPGELGTRAVNLDNGRAVFHAGGCASCHATPDQELPFPLGFRRALGIWKLLFLDAEPLRPDPRRSAAWNRGAYLVNGAGHCAECHSPRNFLGAIASGLRFTGGPNPAGRGWVP